MSKIVIASLDIDIQALLKSTSDLKKEIDKIKNSQKDLAASGQTTSEAFIENEAVLKSLNSAYSNNIKVMQESGKATAQQADQSELLNLALNQEVNSISEAREQNKILNKLRNETNVTTKEGQAQLTALNAKLDANNEFIKENADAYLKQKINIGNYSDSIKEAAQNLNPLNGGMAGFVERSQQAGGAGNLVTQSLKGVITGIYGMIKASLAFIATPIGAVIAVIGLVVGILVAAFRNLDPVLDKIEQGFAAVSAVIDTVRQTIVAIVTGAKSLGEAFSGLGGKMSKAASDAAKLKEAQQDLADTMRSQEVANAKASQQFDELIVKSKNRTITEEQRIAFIQKAQKIEEANFRQRAALAEAELKQAIESARIKGDLSDQELKNLQKNTMAYGNYLLNTGRITEAELEAIKKAELGKIKIQDETTKRLEKSQNAEDKLAEKAAEKAEKAASDAETRRQKQEEQRQKSIDAAIKQQEDELRLLEEKNRFETDELKKAETLAQKEVEILKTKLKNKKISQTEYNAAILAIENNLKETQKEKEEEELQRVKDFNQKKTDLENQIEIQKATTQAEKDALKLSQDLEKHLLELETIKANETEKAELKKLILEQYNLDVQKLTEDAAQKQLEIENQAAIKTIEYNKAKNDVVIGLAQQLGQTLIGLLGNSLAGQLAAIAFDAIIQIAKVKIATASAQQINTAQAIASAPAPFNIPAIVAATAQNVALGASSKLQQASILGAAAVSGIGAVARKFEKGGIQEVGGKRHSAGGTKFYGEDGTVFEAEAGEGIGILNRNAFSSFMDFNNRNGNGRSSGGFFQGGGIITQGVKSNQMDAATIIKAVRELPAPIVAVEEIQSVGNQYVNVKANADF